MDVIKEISKNKNIAVRNRFDDYYEARYVTHPYNGKLICFFNSESKTYKMYNDNNDTYTENILKSDGYQKTSEDLLDIIVKHDTSSGKLIYIDNLPIVTELKAKEIQKGKRKIFSVKEE